MPGNALQPILVVGSLNLDLVMRMPRLPAAGETLSSLDSASFCGGKGANQAVACARLGAPVAMIGRLGDDAAGRQLWTALVAESIAIDAVTIGNGASGMAVIIVTPDGENRILLAGGANQQLSPHDIAAATAQFESAGLLLCQLEVPLETVAAAIAQATARGIRVLLNPAPARALAPSLLAQVDYLVPNETEAQLLTGLPVHDPRTAEPAALALRAQGARHVIITLGAAGILIADDAGCRHVAARPASVVDTTAAGDSFIGGLATGLSAGMTLDRAAERGLQAAALCVGRAGAQSALPYADELPGSAEVKG